MRILTITLLGLAATAGMACADPVPVSGQNYGTAKKDGKRAEQDAIRAAVQRGEVLPLPRILAIARARVPGDVIEVELERESWGIKYEVKILTATGRVREVEVNARTGALVKIEEK